MTSETIENKKYIASTKWRLNNPEKWREISRNNMKKQYIKKREEIKEKNRRHYHNIKEKKDEVKNGGST